MRKTNLIYLFLICFLSISCQRTTSKLELEVINETVLLESDSTIYIKESCGWEIMKEKLNRKVYLYLKNQSIVLTDSEYSYIINEIRENENYNWDSKLFTNSIRISQNEARRYLKQKNLPFNLEFDTALKRNDTIVLSNPKNRPYFADSFSKPIFFRDNKFCIFFYGCVAEDNSSDHFDVAFYKKVEGKWVRWVKL